MPHFNLVHEPWIPCIPCGGRRPEPLSLRDALVHAHEQSAVIDSSPLVTVALHRLLLVVLHRLFGPHSADEWWALQKRQCFDAVALDSYLTEWYHRFDLFDPERPFYQVPPMSDANTISVAKLALEMASGNNVTLFDHTTGSTAAFTPADAARYLIAFQAFAVGGGVSEPFNLSDAPLARDYSVLMRGNSLFETLLLNMVRYTDELPFPRHGTDLPWWECDSHAVPDRAGTYPTGYLDYLTWQSRRVHLIYDSDTGLIRDCQVRQNLKLAGASSDRDPFKAYRLSEKTGWTARRFSGDRAVWRDSHALVTTTEEDSTGRRPAIFDWLASVQPTGMGRRRGTARIFAFDVLGYLTDGPQAKIVLWRHERLPLALEYLTDKRLRDKLREAISLAEDVSALFRPGFGGARGQTRYPRPMSVLAQALLASTSDRRPDQNDLTLQIDHLGAERGYWSGLEMCFRRFMVDLAAGESDVSQWARTVREVARSTFSAVVRELDTSARSLRAAALAERAFNRQLAELLSDYSLPREVQEEKQVVGS